MPKLISIVLLFALAGALMGPEGIKGLIAQHVTVVVVIVFIALLVLAFGSQRGSNSLLQGLFAYSGVGALIFLIVMLVIFEQQAKDYVTARLCRDYAWTASVCRLFGVQ